MTDILPYIETIGLPAFVDGVTEPSLSRILDVVQESALRGNNKIVTDQVEDYRPILKRRAMVEQSEPLPEVKPLLERRDNTVDNQAGKDGGLNTRFMIENLRRTLAHIEAPTTSRNRQMQLEQASYEAAEAELQHTARQLELAGLTELVGNSNLSRKGLQKHMYEWHTALTAYLESKIGEMRQKDNRNPEDLQSKWSSTQTIKDTTMLVYLTVLPPKKLALVTILELMRMVGSGGITDGMKTLRGIMAVGKAVEGEHRAETIRQVAGKKSLAWQSSLDKHTKRPDRVQITRTWHAQNPHKDSLPLDGNTSTAGTATTELGSVWTPNWTQMMQISVGSFLVESLIETARVERRARDPVTDEIISETQPVFSHSYEYVRGKKLGVIRVNPEVARCLGTDSLRQVIHPKHLPMLVQPRPWSSFQDGAYLASQVQMMRFKDSKEQANYIEESCKKGLLKDVYRGLDVLSSTPWRINRGVFDIVLKAWNDGDAIGDIPASVEKSEYIYPEKPDPRENDPSVRSDYIDRYRAVALQQAKDHGERCKYNYNLEIARSYVNDVFYIPHNLDFRGRAYPIPPHLSPVGDDLCRGLLTFGVAKPLGTSGLKWLQIHLANLYGFDKASFEERVDFAKKHEADVFDSADDPLGGSRWWLKAEDPWQCLACCFELAAALRSEDPTQFMSSLPVHQDGTCNGMQHYAALGGDVRGAQAVNLEKGDRPADIYNGVAELVNASIAEDRANNVPIAQWIDGPLSRKIVKQTVMTTVYGVTFIGARDQISRQLAARGGIPSDELYHVSGYVAKKVLASIGDLFAGAKAIQDWLTLCARLISKSISAERVYAAAQESQAVPPPPKKGSRPPRKVPTFRERIPQELMTAVVWTSPLGLPVAQPYRKEAKKQVMTSLQTVFIHDPQAPSTVNGLKQASAFPPNFIHSLDATHMLLTAVMCNTKDITFASVHDSYWTHASTVERMSDTIRDTFIHLHGSSLISSLRDEFLNRYGDYLIPVGNTSSRFVETTIDKKRARELELKQERAAATKEKAAFADEKILNAEEEVDEDEDVQDDVLDVSDIGGTDVKRTIVEGVEFVRFRDVLPPPPPRGEFDVNRIKDSQYFFS